ncbi:ribonuclease G [Wohlfahrtiimonas sp. G9077]|uniref:ribonuclease G n=1 Tax=Wohlfahrtiimonas sp. G9077 TaxID=1980118 RepID=UPI000B9955E0|nr:ribonuclease G [Wohlfahrtiimonas sp. G9077]OYQ72559.1 ribonuclease E/G [Wohlfahrtiimonas sp. G9077]
MSDEILINKTPYETRAAVMRDGVLQEILIERTDRNLLVGNIYKGKVVRVLPGMEAAFVDIGLERAAFLHVNDIHTVRNSLELEKQVLPDEDEGSTNDEKPVIAPPKADITAILHQGQEVVVQVIKDPLGTKGARLTTQISIPSCYLVYLAESDVIGVSIRIEQEEERTRLKEHLTQYQAELGGAYIARTAAEGVDPWVLRADMQFLSRLWDNVSERIKQSKAGDLIYGNFPLELRILRDYVGRGIQQIRVDAAEPFEKMRGFAEDFLPETLDNLQLYKGSRPIFDLYNIEEEIEKALSNHVSLKSGGYIIIEQTEAMTTIDVNTGAYVGHRNLEETIFKTNLEAAGAIAHQVRLRNLGGMIIIDFIDMTNPEHQQSVLDELQSHLAMDNARTTISAVTSLGLVEMTRKRTRESLEHILCEKCPTCQGKGYIKTKESICYEIFREVVREAKQYPNISGILILASADVIEQLLDEEAHHLAELQTFTKLNIKLQAEALYNVEQFDIILL